MQTDLNPCDSLVALDRKVSRALTKGKGMRLSGDDLERLASLGMIEMLSSAKAAALKEQARCRQLRVVSTNGANSGSTMSEAGMENPPANDFTSGGTTPPPDDSSARQRAREIFV